MVFNYNTDVSSRGPRTQCVEGDGDGGLPSGLPSGSLASCRMEIKWAPTGGESRVDGRYRQIQIELWEIQKGKEGVSSLLQSWGVL